MGRALLRAVTGLAVQIIFVGLAASFATPPWSFEQIVYGGLGVALTGLFVAMWALGE